MLEKHASVTSISISDHPILFFGAGFRNSAGGGQGPSPDTLAYTPIGTGLRGAQAIWRGMHLIKSQPSWPSSAASASALAAVASPLANAPCAIVRCLSAVWSTATEKTQGRHAWWQLECPRPNRAAVGSGATGEACACSAELHTFSPHRTCSGSLSYTAAFSGPCVGWGELRPAGDGDAGDVAETPDPQLKVYTPLENAAKLRHLIAELQVLLVEVEDELQDWGVLVDEVEDLCEGL
ncbi:hypothetical protein GGS24DRAFT_507152 [Hypoxylon argillaceum]|nr:hypothetical protein GGS24DRAFT_507152 [Hypoxylon argillaceum]